MLTRTLLAVAVATLPVISAQVVGKAFGMATGTTGGGDARPQIPVDYKELKSLLSDDVPRVIVIDKEWDFTNTEGTVTTSGCEPRACPVSAGGQNLLGTLNCPDASNDKDVLLSSIEYDAATDTPLKVASNKTLLGRGPSATIAGKGLDLSGSSNIIVQNLHITDLNPKSVWGGDAITLDGTDRVWIDHCTFSLIGRQMLVSGWNAAGRVTISSNEFDGRSPWSRTCNGEHYWAILLIGADDRYTFHGNWLHDISGRAPHYGTDKNGATNVFHAVNNLFENMSGHAFDAEPSTWSLIEGNTFINVSQPMTGYSLERANSIFDVPVGSEGDCEVYIGRKCELNSLDSDSGKLGEVRDIDALKRVAKEAGETLVVAKPAKDVAASVRANAGAGRLSEDKPVESSSAVVVVKSTTIPTPTPARYNVTSSATPSQNSASKTYSLSKEEAVVSLTLPVASPVAASSWAPTSAASIAAIPTSTCKLCYSQKQAQLHQRCGGSGWAGPTTCARAQLRIEVLLVIKWAIYKDHQLGIGKINRYMTQTAVEVLHLPL
ncbi:hypothetical protein OPT61_g3854 [Boeremia exigua]|uniref:Uncharacterized protein n=1 Tax=Boeremia exigua TaxID=749465 RepID=A0ACC2IGE4_9PLEO|nr:hypothetical protein OPT61_g3854 [Boeremia exigua]